MINGMRIVSIILVLGVLSSTAIADSPKVVVIPLGDSVKAPRLVTKVLTVSAIEYFPRYGGTQYKPYSGYSSNGRTFRNSSGGDSSMWASVHLPTGARVTSVRFYYWDNGAGNLDMKLKKYDGTRTRDMSEVTTSGSSSSRRSLIDSTIQHPSESTIDIIDESASYYLHVGLNAWASISTAENYGIGHTVITYETLE